MDVTYVRERTYIVQKALFASSTTLHLVDDDSALEGWPVTLTFAVGKHGNIALLATGGRNFCGGNNDSVFVGRPPIATFTLVIRHSGEAVMLERRRL